MPTIRPSQAQDITAITALYAHHVLNGTGSFELDPPCVDEMTARRADVLGKGLPYLVAFEDDCLVGFAYCNWFKPRPAYRYSAEDSIYLAANVQGTGLGRALLAELVEQAHRAGVRKLIAVIGDSANTGSVAVHQAVGFLHVGTLKAVGWKFNQWRDVVLMDKTIGPGHSRAPNPDAL